MISLHVISLTWSLSLGSGVISLMAHTSVPFGLRHLKAATPDGEVRDDLCKRLQGLLPWLPPPAHVALHAWRLSQVPLASAQNGPSLTCMRRACVVCVELASSS